MTVITRRSFLWAALAASGCATLRPRPSTPPDAYGPVLWPTQPWEGTCAMPFSGGIHFDAADQVFKCWYMGGWPQAAKLCLAVSEDGRRWGKPDLDVVAGTNIVADLPGLDTATVIPHNGRWHLAYTRGNGPLRLMDSADGVHWNFLGQTPNVGDRTTMFWNPIRERWAFSVRAGAGCCSDPRRADLVESDTFVPTTWNPRPWLAADDHDACPGEYCGAAQGQLYAVDAFAWGDRLIALLTIWRGLQPDRPKLNDVCWATSADGLTWQRPSYEPFLLRSDDPASWRYGNVQGVAGGVHKMNGQVFAYCSGRSASEACATGLRVLDRAPWDAVS